MQYSLSFEESSASTDLCVWVHRGNGTNRKLLREGVKGRLGGPADLRIALRLLVCAGIQAMHRVKRKAWRSSSPCVPEIGRYYPLQPERTTLGRQIDCHVWTSDAYPAYEPRCWGVFREERVPSRTGKPGRPAGPRLVPPEGMGYATVQKVKEQGRVTVRRRSRAAFNAQSPLSPRPWTNTPGGPFFPLAGSASMTDQSSFADFIRRHPRRRRECGGRTSSSIRTGYPA